MKVYGIQIEDINTEEIFTSSLVKTKEEAELLKTILEDPIHYNKYHRSYDHKDPAWYIFGNAWYDTWEICINVQQTPEEKLALFKSIYKTIHDKDCHYSDGVILTVLDISIRANYLKSTYVRYSIVEMDLYF